MFTDACSHINTICTKSKGYLEALAEYANILRDIRINYSDDTNILNSNEWKHISNFNTI